jgi:CheY-like chemotaxis protein
MGLETWEQIMLVAEDTDDDIEVLKLACARAKVSLPLHRVRNGQAAIDYLEGNGIYKDRSEYPMPTLLLLDLKMPLRNGFDVLEWVRPGLRRLVIVLFTLSDIPADITRAFELGANSYVVKPVSFEKLQETVRYLEAYWTKVNRCADCSTPADDQPGDMRVFVRNSQTCEYFQGGNLWTTDPAKALDFERSERAAQWALGRKLQRFDIVVELAVGKPQRRAEARL